jgi:hypothetical protein
MHASRRTLTPRTPSAGGSSGGVASTPCELADSNYTPQEVVDSLDRGTCGHSANEAARPSWESLLRANPDISEDEDPTLADIQGHDSPIALRMVEGVRSLAPWGPGESRGCQPTRASSEPGSLARRASSW